MRIRTHIASLLLAAASVSAQILGTTNTLDNVLMTTPMWSLADPFGFADLASATGRVATLELSSQSVTTRVSLLESAGYATTQSVAVVAASALDAYSVGTNAASIASAANATATNASALAASVHANSTNALAVAYAANVTAGTASTLASLAYGLAGSYYGYATNAIALATAADAKADAALALISAAADPYILLARPEAGLYSGYSDLSMTNPSVPSNRIYSVYTPTSSVWRATWPDWRFSDGSYTNDTVGPMPYPLTYPVPGGVAAWSWGYDTAGSGGSNTLYAVTNAAGGVDLHYYNGYMGAYGILASTNLTALAYTNGAGFALVSGTSEAWAGTFTVSFSYTLPPSVTTLVAVAATKADVSSLGSVLGDAHETLTAEVSDIQYAVFGYADPGSTYPGFDLFTSYIAHTNDSANPHSVTAAQTGAVSTNELASLVDTNELNAALAPLVDTNDLTAAIAAIPEPYTVRDTTDTNRWWRFEGTQAVQYALGAVVTNYTVTLSTNFMEFITYTRPVWTNNVWPFVDGVWEGTNTSGSFVLNWNGAENNPGAQWLGAVADWNANPLVTLSPSFEAVDTATVYQHVYYPTNATGNVLGPVPTNLVTYAQLLAWWIETEATKIDAQEFEDHVTPVLVADPHIQYLLETNAVTAEMVTNIAHAVNEVTTIHYAVSNVSDIAGYLVLTNTPSTNETKYIVANNPTNGEYVAQFVAEPFGIAGSVSEGHIETRVHMSISGGGGSLSVVAEPYLVDGAGNTVIEWSGGNAVPVPGVDGDGNLFVTPVNTAYTYAPTDRRAVKIKVVAKTGAPVLTIAMENGKQLTLAFPVPTSFFASKLDLMDYLPKTYTNTIPVAGNTLLTLDGTNLTVTGATFAHRATVTNAYRLNMSATAPAFHYGLTILGTNAVTFADNLLLRGTATVTGTNCVAFQPWTNGTWEVLWGGK